MTNRVVGVIRYRIVWDWRNGRYNGQSELGLNTECWNCLPKSHTSYIDARLDCILDAAMHECQALFLSEIVRKEDSRVRYPQLQDQEGSQGGTGQESLG